MLQILSGPYGSHLNDILEKKRLDSAEKQLITDPSSILYKGKTRDLIKEIAVSYLDQGSNVLTTNTFDARNKLKGDYDSRIIYREIILAHLDLIQVISDEDNKIAVSFGPYGDCYKPEEAPKNIEDGEVFWESALEPLTKNTGQLDYALAETVNNETEAVAIAKAWVKIRKHVKGKVQGVISFIPEKAGVRLLSGERIADVIKAIASEIGTIPVLFGLNCCPAAALEPTLKDILADQGISSNEAQFRFFYPNASDIDPLQLEQSRESIVSREPEDVAGILDRVITLYEKSLPNAAPHVIVNECCGGSPERTGVISRKLRQIKRRAVA